MKEDLMCIPTGKNCALAMLGAFAIIPMVGCERVFSVKMENRASTAVLIHANSALVGRVEAGTSAVFPRGADDVTLDITAESTPGKQLGDLRISPDEKRKADFNHRQFDLIWDGKKLRSR